MENIRSCTVVDENAPEVAVDLGSHVVYKKPCVAPKVKKVSGGKFYLLVKRAVDILASLLGMLVLALPMLIIAVVIKLDSPGTVLYKQERLGKNGKPFNVLKFRSMRMDAETAGAQWASDKDPRVTRVGEFLRKCRLDELPQLWCIFVGDMTIVGPRPERPIFYKEFGKYIDGFDQRLLVEPGLTGLAQVRGGYDLAPDEKVVYDIEYIETRSLWNDLKIIFETVAIVFTHDGAR